MACACKVTRQLDFLHQKYGDKQPTSKKTNIVNKTKTKLTTAFLIVLALPLIPFVILKTKKKNQKRVFNLNEILKLNKQKNVRKQQVI